MSDKPEPEETVTLPRERILELMLLQERARALRAELAIAEASLQQFGDAIGAELVEGGKYEITGNLDLTTGIVKRRRAGRALDPEVRAALANGGVDKYE